MFEVIVIDNLSTDNTLIIAEKAKKNFQNFQLFTETKLGLSHARNKSIELSKSPIIAFLDDDAIAKPNWLEFILKAFSLDETIAVAGGKINAIWEETRPEWLADNLLPFLTIINWSEKPFFLDSRQQFLAGANIAFKKDHLISHGKFDISLGRIGTKLLSGEETLLVDKMKASGLKAYYDPAIEVDHIVPGNRLKKQWFMDRVYWEGFSEATLEMRKKESSKLSFGYLRAKVLIKKVLILLFFKENKNRFSTILDIKYQLGYLSSLLRTKNS